MTKPESEFCIARTDEGTVTVHMPRTLDSVSTPKIRSQCLAALEEAEQAVVIELADTAFMDSAGIGLLVSMFRTSKGRGLNLSLRGPRDQPLALIKSVQMEKVISIETA